MFSCGTPSSASPFRRNELDGRDHTSSQPKEKIRPDRDQDISDLESWRTAITRMVCYMVEPLSFPL